jgi:3-oxoadipate enol-lactonase
MSAIDPDAYRIGARAVWLADQRERAGAIRVPTLVICGSQDRVTPPALSHVLAQSIPGAQQAAIEGAGHLGNIEKPAEFDTLVGAFIRGVDSRSS